MSSEAEKEGYRENSVTEQVDSSTKGTDVAAWSEVFFALRCFVPFAREPLAVSPSVLLDWHVAVHAMTQVRRLHGASVRIASQA